MSREGKMRIVVPDSWTELMASWIESKSGSVPGSELTVNHRIRVTGISHAVDVPVVLRLVRQLWAVITSIRSPVAVLVRLTRVSGERTQIADIAGTVAVGVLLSRVARERAVVLAIGMAVGVHVRGPAIQHEIDPAGVVAHHGSVASRRTDQEVGVAVRRPRRPARRARHRPVHRLPCRCTASRRSRGSGR